MRPLRAELKPTVEARRAEDRIRAYEGLVRKTASLLEGRVDESYEDLCSMIRIKVWRALESYDPERSKLPERNYVFSCVVNLKKDLYKKEARRDEDLYLEDLTAAAGFEERYLAVEEVVQESLEDEGVFLPSTLSHVERRVITYLYVGYTEWDARRELGLKRGEMADAMGAIRAKMADWAPTPSHAAQGGHLSERV